MIVTMLLMAVLAGPAAFAGPEGGATAGGKVDLMKVGYRIWSPGDCKAFLRDSDSYCTSGDCKAILRGSDSYCDTDDCKAVLRGSDSYCD